MPTLNLRLQRLEDHYYELPWYRSGLFWMMSILCLLAHIRVIQGFVAAWPTLEVHGRFLAAIVTLGLHTPWGATLTYHVKTRRRLLAEASVDLRREIGRVQTFAVGFLYFLLFVTVGVMMQAIR